MDPLTKLAIKYGTDKWGKHHYTPVYHDLFKDRRNDIKTLVEIGIAEGAGARMFRDYFPNAEILGLEIEGDRLIKEDRINSMSFDQSDPKDVAVFADMLSKVDIVIDDGSHNPLDQLLTCYGFMSLSVNKKAIYVIEDVADIRIAEFLDKRLKVKVVECGKRYDDRLVIVRHKDE